MFSPKVLYRLPCMARILMTLFVGGLAVGELGSCAHTMNCSFRTSCDH